MNPKPYSNTKATLAIAKASFRSILRSPSAVVFTLAFPLIFIIVFANIGGGGVTVDVGVAKTCDTISPVYQALKNVKVVHLVKDQSTEEMNMNLSKGSIDAIINIQKNNTRPPFTVNVEYTKASAEKGNILRSVLSNIYYNINNNAQINTPPVAEIRETTIQGREYKYIDFILPGQLGFSLLSSGVFGTAFVFLSLRLTLVIKRFFATPVKRYSIVLGEALARMTFSLLGSLFIILVGHYMFGFTLVHGVTTVLNMLVLSAIGLIIFMGFGFTISGIAKNESTVPPLSNIITLPQFLLSGTFFSVTAFPKWLQGISNVLPLTHLNNAMRKVAFEGVGLGDVTHQLFILLIWFVIIYAVAVKTFKWE
ncbi:ABC-2 type transport system permease protein [Mucilaginibacter lappiensis]|uniref:Transport permease protein n=1 Tax=Mucilaginibacter lappiensis TaxID=354630 RepID=A0ABR6PTM9_9SPHI|nr:ABC transporter permease [Mucilaginibacter lappiensis]MBB6112335.1 ABC-2 type transport system permease protein [Mucilaginibacter lappiensis]SIR96907.1 ABC-2 type transport system permease protein [Mucilaginibacter lappiensis]